MSEAASALQELIGARVRPLALANERLVPVREDLVDLFPAGGIRRGSIVSCSGSAPLSLALALAAAPSQAGSWVGVVGLEQLGVAAAIEHGVAAERLFRVEDPPPAQLATVLAAVADGVDVVLACGTGVRHGDARRLAARLATKGGMLLVVGEQGGFSPDLVCRVTSSSWEGLGWGTGRLVARTVTVTVTGRRAGQPRHTVTCW